LQAVTLAALHVRRRRKCATVDHAPTSGRLSGSGVGRRCRSGSDETIFRVFYRSDSEQEYRVAYYHAISEFLSWCQRCGFRNLEDIEPITVAAYIEQHSGSPATIKQHMAAIRMMFSWLTEKGILAMNPAREVKTPKFSRNEGKTPAPPAEEVQKLIDSIDLSHIVGLRDQAILGVLAYTFARIGAVVSLQVKDYFQVGKRSVLRFSEKGGKEKEIPVHHKLESILDRYLDASGLRGRPDSPLFLAARGRIRELNDHATDRVAAWMMVKRRLENAGIATIYSNHSFRAAGITNFLENGGTLEVAQRIAGHADSRTTKLYDRRGQKVLVEDMERIRYGG
jgi:site-specific recombinase XerD